MRFNTTAVTCRWHAGERIVVWRYPSLPGARAQGPRGGRIQMTRTSLAMAIGLAGAAVSLLAQNPQPASAPQGPPARDPLSPGFVKATELPDGAVPPVNAGGNFIISADHPPSPDMTAKDGV